MLRRFAPIVTALSFCSILVISETRAGSLPTRSPVPVPASLRTSYDRLSDQSTVEARSNFAFKDKGRMSGYTSVQLGAFFTSAGDSVSAPDSVTFMVIHGAKVRFGVAMEGADWWFSESNDHKLKALSDDIRFDLGSMLYFRGSLATSYLEERSLKSAPGYPSLPEILVITLPTSRLRDLFDASSTEGMVDGFRFFIHNKTGGADKLYREFSAYLRDLSQAGR